MEGASWVLSGGRGGLRGGEHVKIFFVVSVVAFLVIAAGCGGAPSETSAPPESVVEKAPANEPVEGVAHDLVFVCACGPDCQCNSVATEAGTCTCGTELKQTHLVKVEGHEGLLCTCDAGCTCEINAEDDTKCACGGDLRRVSFEGTGLYYCNCGGSCTCNFVSSEAGKCSCGMDLVTST